MNAIEFKNYLDDKGIKYNVSLLDKSTCILYPLSEIVHELGKIDGVKSIIDYIKYKNLEDEYSINCDYCGYCCCIDSIRFGCPIDRLSNDCRIMNFINKPITSIVFSIYEQK